MNMKINKARESSSAVHDLLESIIASARKASASSVHFYLEKDESSCLFKIAGRLIPSPKNINQRILSELLDFIKSAAKLESSKVPQAQVASLKIFEEETLSLSYIQNIRQSSSHLVIHLNPGVGNPNFEDLGFSGDNLDVLEDVLDSKKGIILVDSLDQYSIREFIYASLEFLNQKVLTQSVCFDSSIIPSPKLKAHDRIYTKLNQKSQSLFEQALSADPRVVVLFDALDTCTLDQVIEISESGRLVLIATSEGSAINSLNKVLNLSPDLSLSKLLGQIKFSVSLTPIKLINSSQHNHTLTENSIVQIENFFAIDLANSWNKIHKLAGINSPSELLELKFPVALEGSSGLTNLVEILSLTEDLKRSISQNPSLSLEALHWLAIRSGMKTKRKDGLIKALQRKVDLADVIEVTK
jgi:hypothetical protein